MGKKETKDVTLKHGMVLTVDDIKDMDLPTPPKHIVDMNVPAMWEKGITGDGITVAIIDSGCDYQNPLLKGKVKAVYNYTADDDGDRANVTDYLGHGTHIAGIIAGENFEDKVMGIAPDVKLLIYKVISKDESLCSYDIIAQAIYASAQAGADIINLSLGGTNESPQVYEAIKYALDLNISVVSASGNNGDGIASTSERVYPGAYHEVIEVGAINSKGKVATFSNTNPDIDCVAHGTKIVSTGINGGFMVMSGTSQSAPMVSGVLALIRQWGKNEFERELKEDEIYSLLIKNTKKIAGEHRNQQGHGCICIDLER